MRNLNTQTPISLRAPPQRTPLVRLPRCADNSAVIRPPPLLQRHPPHAHGHRDRLTLQGDSNTRTPPSQTGAQKKRRRSALQAPAEHSPYEPGPGQGPPDRLVAGIIFVYIPPLRRNSQTPPLARRALRRHHRDGPSRTSTTPVRAGVGAPEKGQGGRPGGSTIPAEPCAGDEPPPLPAGPASVSNDCELRTKRESGGHKRFAFASMRGIVTGTRFVPGEYPGSRRHRPSTAFRVGRQGRFGGANTSIGPWRGAAQRQGREAGGLP